MDLPIGRTKPPHNSYEISDLKIIFDKYENIKYLAVSNVETSKDLNDYITTFSDSLTIVPKIESKNGVDNINSICEALTGKKIIMLDHDDLLSDLIRISLPPSEFFGYIERLEKYCNENSIYLLKTRGVIFSDEDEYRYEK